MTWDDFDEAVRQTCNAPEGTHIRGITVHDSSDPAETPGNVVDIRFAERLDNGKWVGEPIALRVLLGTTEEVCLQSVVAQE